ncbi:LacI family DNA-binding transcriptional regulator [Kineococcus glutinatus]|uniref:LacI family DNA-binding transcriptional regulator n=1 Tax=Kineococcus glutinatus TaxID=1070872 RepID=A0ABP9HVZ4_9ACTN
MPTINDVAEAAGVSASTVSYVLSGKRSISAATRARVERAIEQLGYRPHAGARALASSRTNVLALMVPLRQSADVNVIMDFVGAVATRARRHDHDVLLLTQDETTGLERVTGGSLVDALIVMDIELDDPRVDVLARLGRPTVLIGVPRDPRGLSCVDFDFGGAVGTAVEHLAALGHRGIGFVGSSPDAVARRAGYAVRVRDGFRAAVAAAGVAGAMSPVEASLPGARAALAAVRAEVPDLTGLVVHNEGALPSVLAVLAEEGTRVPQDVSVVSIEAADASQHLPGRPTSIDLPSLEVGTAAVDMVMARLEGSVAPETRLVPATLTDRGTTAPPRRGGRAGTRRVSPSRRR